MHEAELMARAVALGDGVRRRTAPNPWVGCVLVAHGTVVGAGATAPPGGPHAEAAAIAAAGDRARGATAYVTLEPCPHRGRTPACAQALVDAGVRRVFVATEDPDPQVRGRGVEALRSAGVIVDVGLGADTARRSLAPYLHHRRTGRAFCLAKTAVSVDGRAAARDGTSRWVTGPVARADAHEQRADSQAIVVGAGTALTDQPRLTVRGADPPLHPPLRVVLDSRGRVPPTGPLFDPDLAPTLVVTTTTAPSPAVDAWRAAGAKVELVDGADDGVDLPDTLRLLGRNGVLQALFEGGPTLHGALWRAGLVDRLVVYLGATVLGADARPAFATAGPGSIDAAPRLSLLDAVPLGDDLRLRYQPRSEA